MFPCILLRLLSKENVKSLILFLVMQRILQLHTMEAQQSLNQKEEQQQRKTSSDLVKEIPCSFPFPLPLLQGANHNFDFPHLFTDCHFSSNW